MQPRHWISCEPRRGIAWKHCRETAKDNGAYASTTSGVSASHSRTATCSMSRSSITTKEDNMAKNKMRPVHPGEILREEYLVPMGMSVHALSQALRVPATRLHEIVKERRSISPDTALRLARYFGTDAQSWLNLQMSYDLKIAEAELKERIEREV